MLIGSADVLNRSRRKVQVIRLSARLNNTLSFKSPQVTSWSQQTAEKATYTWKLNLVAKSPIRFSVNPVCFDKQV